MRKILFILGFLLLTSSVSAEKIILHSGFEFDGRVIEKTDKFIKVDFLGTPITYYLNEVDSVDGQKIGLPPSARSELSSGDAATVKESSSLKEPELVTPPESGEKSSQELGQKTSGTRQSVKKSGQPVKTMKDETKGKKGAPGALVFGMIFGALLMYIFTAVCLQQVAKKVQIGPIWWAWAPVANFFLMSKIAQTPYQWLWVLLAGFIPVVGHVVVWGFFLFLWHKIGEIFDPPIWVKRLLIVPFANFVGMWYVAFSQKNLVMPKDPLQR